MRRLSLLTTALVLALAACGGDDATDTGTCTTGDVRCAEADVLEECTEGAWTVSQDCAADGMMCHEEGGHCMEMSDDTGM